MPAFLRRIFTRNVNAVLLKRNFFQTPKCLAEMFDPMDHATGIEKKELLAKASGNDDPFGVRKVVKRGCGTQEEPTLIPSCFEARLIGCICEKDQRFACWMWLEKGCPKRCECGHWFKIQEIKPLGH